MNDSQFLDFLMLAHSNQDFSAYINLMFEGAQKLYVQRLKDGEVAYYDAKDEDMMMLTGRGSLDGGNDQEYQELEAQLEAFMSKARFDSTLIPNLD